MLSLLTIRGFLIFFTGIKGAIGKGKRPRDECSDIFLEAKINNALPENYDETVFCAKNANEREATCEGDSGKFYFICDFMIKL